MEQDIFHSSLATVILHVLRRMLQVLRGLTVGRRATLSTTHGYLLEVGHGIDTQRIEAKCTLIHHIC